MSSIAVSGDWERSLWRRQYFADNYIPPGLFLSSLEKNPNFKPYTYWPLVFLSCGITQHVSTIFIFLVVFVRLEARMLDPRVVIWAAIGCFLVGYTTWELLDRGPTNWSDGYTNHLKVLKSSILFFLGLMSLSPVLRTLTAATSSDSIWALSAILFILNTLLADYSALKYVGQTRERLTSVLSMNAAISASVVLASRLATDVAVFALILFSVQAFALFPMLRRRIQASSKTVQISITVLLSCLTSILTASLSWIVAFLFFMGITFIAFLAPAVLVWAQKYKNEIRGPWDVAIPKVN